MGFWQKLPQCLYYMSANCKGFGETALMRSITKTYLYNFDPLKPHFYIVKLGFTGEYTIFLFLLKNIDCGYSLEPPRRGGSNEYPQSMFLSRNKKKYQNFLSENFHFPVIKFSVYLNRRVLVMGSSGGFCWSPMWYMWVPFFHVLHNCWLNCWHESVSF